MPQAMKTYVSYLGALGSGLFALIIYGFWTEGIFPTAPAVFLILVGVVVAVVNACNVVTGVARWLRERGILR
jgi:hypothetical protein